jgi:uncharacterized membrane protein
MARTMLIYGLISGAVIIAVSILFLVNGSGHHSSVWLGYLVMVVGLSSILVGVRQYRDRTLGGVIRFWPALGLGLGIAVVASVVYVAVWEAYLAFSHYNFMDEYAASVLAHKRAAGVTGAAYQKAVAEVEQMRAVYANPLTRFAMTFIEIFPVGLVIAVISAALLRNPRFLPAKAAA